MYKDEMIQLHQFLVYVLKFLAENNQMTDDYTEYHLLNISPHHIHKTKAEHKHAIFVLCNIISKLIEDNDNNSIPETFRTSLSYLVERSEKELKTA